MTKFIQSTLLLCLFTISLQASVVVTNGLTHRHQVQSSTVERGTILLKNVGKKPQRIQVYFNDLKVGCESEKLDVALPGSQQRSNANWIEVGMEQRLLAPGEEFALKYQIKTPDNKLTGTYWSLLMVEIKKPIDTTSIERGVRVSSNVRYAVQIITDFGTDEPTKVEFKDVDYTNTKSDGKALSIELSNDCEKMVVPQVKLEIYNDKGELLFEKKADSKKLYPKQCRKFLIPVSELPSGKFQAVIVADCGGADLFGMTLNLEVDD